MKNPHIIVDPLTKRCLCGTYGIFDAREPGTSCGDILAAMDRLVKSGANPDALLVQQTIITVVEDRESNEG